MKRSLKFFLIRTFSLLTILITINPYASDSKEKYLTENRFDDNFGNWSSILDEFKHFDDYNGSKRVSEYVYELISNINKGDNTQNSIYKTNNKFSIDNWEKMMGKTIAKHTTGLYIKQGILYVRINSASLKQEMFLILNRIQYIN